MRYGTKLWWFWSGDFWKHPMWDQLYIGRLPLRWASLLHSKCLECRHRFQRNKLQYDMCFKPKLLLHIWGSLICHSKLLLHIYEEQLFVLSLIAKVLPISIHAAANIFDTGLLRLHLIWHISNYWITGVSCAACPPASMHARICSTSCGYPQTGHDLCPPGSKLSSGVHDMLFATCLKKCHIHTTRCKGSFHSW
jgi:hypothetical protein